MSLLISSPYPHHIQLTVIDSTTGKQDGLHLQPLCKNLKVPEGYYINGNDLVHWPKLRVTETAPQVVPEEGA